AVAANVCDEQAISAELDVGENREQVLTGSLQRTRVIEVVWAQRVRRPHHRSLFTAAAPGSAFGPALVEPLATLTRGGLLEVAVATALRRAHGRRVIAAPDPHARRDQPRQAQRHRALSGGPAGDPSL